MSNQNSNIVRALLAQRRAFLQQGSHDKVAALDLRLKFLGHLLTSDEPETAVAEPAAERSVAPRGRKRKAV